MVYPQEITLLLELCKGKSIAEAVALVPPYGQYRFGRSWAERTINAWVRDGLLQPVVLDREYCVRWPAIRRRLHHQITLREQELTRVREALAMVDGATGESATFHTPDKRVWPKSESFSEPISEEEFFSRSSRSAKKGGSK